MNLGRRDKVSKVSSASFKGIVIISEGYLQQQQQQKNLITVNLQSEGDSQT
jgi:hypothetical protein